MVAVISRMYGLEYIEMAEDLVSETFLLASETWGVKGIPENPTAWLYAVAKQKTLHHFRRSKIYTEKVMPQVMSGQDGSVEPELSFSQENIRDSQLQMLFAVCDPSIASEAQMGLALRILCGFGIDEIAEAFFTNKETINKRLFRAKEKLRAEKVQMELPPESEIVRRLDNVLHIIYLLFSEGYYSKTQNEILRKDLCIEALRLGVLLTGYEKTNVPKTHALVALMCFHASRFAAREGQGEEPVLYDDQDDSLWDQELIRRGAYFLNLSATGDEVTSYHLEARIAQLHCMKEDRPEKWAEVMSLYDQLIQINYSPSVALNRVFALFKLKGAKEALAEAEQLKMDHNHFYLVLLGELHSGLNQETARGYFEQALALAKTQTEKQGISRKIQALEVLKG